MHGARMDDGPNGSTLVISLGESWQWFWHASPMFWTRHIVSYWRALIDKMTGMLCVGCCWIAWSFGCRDRLLDVFLFWLTWNLLQVVELEQVKVCLKAICLFENVGVRPNWLERNQVSHVLRKMRESTYLEENKWIAIFGIKKPLESSFGIQLEVENMFCAYVG